MPNITTFREFCQAVSKGLQPVETRCTADTPKEVLELLECATKAAPWLSDMGISSKSSGNGNIQQNGFSFRAGSHTFTVMPPTGKKQPPKKGVAQTSIEKYHSIDTTGQTLQVVVAATSLSFTHGFTTDSQVAQFIGIPSARVSARRNEIEAACGAVVMGIAHRFEAAGRVTCPVTGSSVNGWRVVRVEVISQPERVQLEMF